MAAIFCSDSTLGDKFVPSNAIQNESFRKKFCLVNLPNTEEMILFIARLMESFYTILYKRFRQNKDITWIQYIKHESRKSWKRGRQKRKNSMKTWKSAATVHRKHGNMFYVNS